MRYPQTFPPSVSPTPCQCNRTIPYQVRRYPAARNLIRGRPSIPVRRQTGNRNEGPLSERLTLPGNGEDGRNPAGEAAQRTSAFGNWLRSRTMTGLGRLPPFRWSSSNVATGHREHRRSPIAHRLKSDDLRQPPFWSLELAMPCLRHSASGRMSTSLSLCRSDCY